MYQHLRLVPDAPVELDHAARIVLCAEVICEHGGPVYRDLAAVVDDEEALDRVIKRLPDRALGAAGMYAAHQGDLFIGSLITFEEGRRLGVLQSTTTNGGSAA